MAAIKFIRRTVALDGNSISEQLPASFFNSENTAHTFIIAATRGGEPLTLTGTVSATFLNPNDAVVVITGSIVDGAAVVTLSSPCYALSGRFILTIDVNGATVYECQSRIKRRSSGTAYDPDDEISIAALSAEIAAMRQATAAANSAASTANSAASIANSAASAIASVAVDKIGLESGLWNLDVATKGDNAARIRNVFPISLEKYSSFSIAVTPSDDFVIHSYGWYDEGMSYMGKVGMYLSPTLDLSAVAAKNPGAAYVCVNIYDMAHNLDNISASVPVLETRQTAVLRVTELRNAMAALSGRVDQLIFSSGNFDLTTGVGGHTVLNRIRTEYPIDMQMYSSIRVPPPCQIQLVLVYDRAMNYLGNYNVYSQAVEIGHNASWPSARYMHLVLRDPARNGGDISGEVPAVTANTVLTVAFARSEDMLARAEALTQERFALGDVDGRDGIAATPSRFCLRYPLRVRQGDMVRINGGDYIATFYEYNDSGTQLYKSPSVGPEWRSANIQKSVYYTVRNDCWLRCSMYDRVNPGAVLTDGQWGDGYMTLIRYQAARAKKYLLDGLRRKAPVKARFPEWQVHGQGGTFIHGKLWSFEGSVRTGSALMPISVIDPATGQAIAKQHNLGHMNSADYAEDTDTLLTYGEDSGGVGLVLYTHPEGTDALSSSDASCLFIPLYKNSQTMNVSASVCFGEASNIVYYFTGIYETSSSDIATDRRLYKLLLGMGDNDLSASGYGTFISGKTPTQYNGTCAVIGIYTGEVEPGLDYFNTANGTSTPQDMQYEDYLYVAYGSTGASAVVIKIDDQAMSYTVINTYFVAHNDYRNERQGVNEPEMIALHDGKIYLGFLQETIVDGRITETVPVVAVINK